MIYMIIACIILIIFDIITGIIKAAKNGTLNSSAMRTGSYHKIGELLALALWFLFEWGGDKINLPISFDFLSVIGIYIAMTEVLSIIENIGEISPEIGNFFKPYLEKLRGDDKDE